MSDVASIGGDFVERVIWADRTWSYAKSWQMRLGDRYETVRVGAGASGNMTLWERGRIRGGQL